MEFLLRLEPHEEGCLKDLVLSSCIIRQGLLWFCYRNVTILTVLHMGTTFKPSAIHPIREIPQSHQGDLQEWRESEHPTYGRSVHGWTR